MRNLPQLYSQQDPQWASIVLGTGNNAITIGTSGCYLCSFAMVANYYGHQVNPAQLNQLFITNNLYVQGNELTDNALQSLYADCIYQQSIDYSNTPASLNILQTYLSDPTISVILEVNANPEGPSSTLETHFVVAVSCDGKNITIADPWTGQLNSGTPYGDWPTTIQKFVVYKGTPMTGTYVDSATFTELVTKSTEDDAFHEAGFATPQAATEQVANLTTARDNNQEMYNKEVTTNAGLTTQLNDAQTDNQTLQEQLTAANKQHETDAAEIITLNGSLEAITNSNKSYATETLDAEHALTAETALLHGLAKDAGINIKGLNEAQIAGAIQAYQVQLENQIKQGQKQQTQTVKTSNQFVKTVIGIFTGRG